MAFQPNKISIKAMCLVIHEGKILASKLHDSAKNEDFYRVLGGGVEFGETGEQAIRREIQEELGCAIENLKFLKLIENLFVYEGQKGHELTFMFSGQLANKELQNKNPIHVVESDYEFDAFWVPIPDILDKKVILYPDCDYKELLG